MSSRPMLQRFLVAFLALVAGVPALGRRAEQSPPPSLLTDAPSTLPEPPFPPRVARPEIVQSRATMVNLAALDGELIDVAVAPDRTLRGTAREPDPTCRRIRIVGGQIEGEPLSAATFVRAGNILQGSIRTLDAAYSLEPLGADGLHAIREVDLQSTGEELPPGFRQTMPARPTRSHAERRRIAVRRAGGLHTRRHESRPAATPRCWRASISASPRRTPPTRTAGSSRGSAWSAPRK